MKPHLTNVRLVQSHTQLSLVLVHFIKRDTVASGMGTFVSSLIQCSAGYAELSFLWCFMGLVSKEKHLELQLPNLMGIILRKHLDVFQCLFSKIHIWSQPLHHKDPTGSDCLII